MGAFKLIVAVVNPAESLSDTRCTGDGTWSEFCAAHLSEFEPDQIAQLIDIVDPNPRKPVVAAADKFLNWLTKHCIM
jgi:hypothetical protein